MHRWPVPTLLLAAMAGWAGCRSREPAATAPRVDTQPGDAVTAAAESPDAGAQPEVGQAPDAGAAEPTAWPDGVPRPSDATDAEVKTSARGDRVVYFHAAGDLAAVWASWLDAAQAADWQIADRHGGVRVGWLSASLYHRTPDGPRAWLQLVYLGEGRGLDASWNEAPGLGERLLAPPPGDCVPIPHPSFRIITHMLGDFEREGRDLEDRFVTWWWWDFDGDGVVDAVAPETERAYCPHDVRRTIYLARGACGHRVGTIEGTIDWAALHQAAPGEHGLPEIVATRQDVSPAPPPGGCGESIVRTVTRHYRYDGTSYLETSRNEESSRRTCSPDGCPVTTCTGIIDLREDGSSFENLKLPEEEPPPVPDGSP